MLEQPADVPAARLRSQGPTASVVEQVVLIIPQALVAVHAACVIGEERLGHECGCLAVPSRDVLAHVFVDHDVVCHTRERSETHVDLVLSRGRHLMVMHFDLDAGLHQRQYDLRADVLQRVVRRNREVALLVARLVTQIASAVGALVGA